MTWFGYLFWGLSALGIATAFFFQWKSGAKAPDTSQEQNLEQEITKHSIRSSNNW